MALDKLVAEYLRLERGVAELGEHIRAGGVPVALAFVDLAGSTAMKLSTGPADWLGYVHRFFETVTGLLGDGRVVKRIGDELLLSFDSAAKGEAFLRRVDASALFERFPCRIGVDYGVCYHLTFAEGQVDDPYGPPADRCARIVSLANPGVILCSADFVEELPNQDAFLNLGEAWLKGMQEPQRLYARLTESAGFEASYLAPLLERLKKPDATVEGYRWAPRSPVPKDLKAGYVGEARPFLARSLLRVPQLPYTPDALFDIIGTSNRADAGSEYVGYLVNWPAEVSSFSRLIVGGYLLHVTLKADSTWRSGVVHLTPEMYEALKDLKKGTEIHIRGVIEDISATSVVINFAEVLAN